MNESKIALDIQGFLKRAIGTVATNVVENAFHPCAVGECGKRSVGFICSRCSRYTCNDHVYIRPALQDGVVICAACVIDSHPELLEG